MSLIDGVIQAGSSFGVQCLQWVNNVTGGAGAGFATAGDLASYASSKGLLHSTPQLGDIAVYNAGQGGAGSAGHAGIVTAISGGAIGVTSTNWGTAGSGATQNFVGQGGGTPSGYVDPTAIGGKNIIAGQTGTTATLASSTTPAASGGGCQSLTSFIESNAHGSSIPVVGGVIGAVTGTALFPVALVEWGTQPCVRWTAGFWLMALGMGGVGFYLFFRKQADAAIGSVAKAAAVG
jgi:hypothetical protein